MYQFNLEEEVKSADLILIGLGERFMDFKDKELLKSFYTSLKSVLERDEKNFYIISFGQKKGMLEAGFSEENIVCPMEEMFKKEDWDKYLLWVQHTLNRKLLILEMGVNFDYPDMVRFAFEKMAYFNMKSKLIRINNQFPQLPDNLKERGFTVSEDPIKVICNVQ